jgi:hypothetical protein
VYVIEIHPHMQALEVLPAVVMKSSVFWGVTPCKKLKLPLKQAVEAHMAVRRRGFHVF